MSLIMQQLYDESDPNNLHTTPTIEELPEEKLQSSSPVSVSESVGKSTGAYPAPMETRILARSGSRLSQNLPTRSSSRNRLLDIGDDVTPGAGLDLETVRARLRNQTTTDRTSSMVHLDQAAAIRGWKKFSEPTSGRTASFYDLQRQHQRREPDTISLDVRHMSSVANSVWTDHRKVAKKASTPLNRLVLMPELNEAIDEEIMTTQPENFTISLANKDFDEQSTKGTVSGKKPAPTAKVSKTVEVQDELARAMEDAKMKIKQSILGQRKKDKEADAEENKSLSLTEKIVKKVSKKKKPKDETPGLWLAN